MNGTAKIQTSARNDAGQNTPFTETPMLQNKTIAESNQESKKATAKKATAKKAAKLKARGAAVVAAAIATPLKDKAIKLTGKDAFTCKRNKAEKPVGNANAGYWYKSMVVKGLPLHRPNLAMAIASGLPLEDILALSNRDKGQAMKDGTPMGLALRASKDYMTSKKHGYRVSLTDAICGGKIVGEIPKTWIELHKKMINLK
jgi:hypothetical protein